MAREAAERAKWEEENPGLASPEPARSAPLAYDSDSFSDMSDMDDEIVSVNDLGPERGSDFDDSDDDTSEDNSIIDSDDEYTSEDDSIIDSDEDIGIENSELGSDIESDDEHDGVKIRSTSQRNAASSAKGNTRGVSTNWSNSYRRGEESDDDQIVNSRGRVQRPMCLRQLGVQPGYMIHTFILRIWTNASACQVLRSEEAMDNQATTLSRLENLKDDGDCFCQGDKKCRLAPDFYRVLHCNAMSNSSRNEDAKAGLKHLKSAMTA